VLGGAGAIGMNRRARRAARVVSRRGRAWRHITGISRGAASRVATSSRPPHS
jgi:hypothetical protein